jgi:hypothetical protein
MEDEKIGEDQLKNILAENLRLTKEIHAMARTIKNYVILQRILSVVYILLIIVPLIIGAIYLPPLIRTLINPYQELLDTGGAMNLGSPAGVGNVLEQAQKILDNQ